MEIENCIALGVGVAVAVLLYRQQFPLVWSLKDGQLNKPIFSYQHRTTNNAHTAPNIPIEREIVIFTCAGSEKKQIYKHYAHRMLLHCIAVLTFVFFGIWFLFGFHAVDSRNSMKCWICFVGLLATNKLKTRWIQKPVKLKLRYVNYNNLLKRIEIVFLAFSHSRFVQFFFCSYFVIPVNFDTRFIFLAHFLVVVWPNFFCFQLFLLSNPVIRVKCELYCVTSTNIHNIDFIYTFNPCQFWNILRASLCFPLNSFSFAPQN